MKGETCHFGNAPGRPRTRCSRSLAGVDQNRLTTRGFGASQPVSSNDTALGRSQNRRVEIVKN
jgi:flagellar motor protein MotB